MSSPPLENSVSRPGVSTSDYWARSKDFVDLHQQVETSVGLLDSLESFLSTFQKDLSAVSGQISDLQDRSKNIENRLRGRRKIERPLSNLLSDVCIPPALAAQILDTDVDESWLPVIAEFESRLIALKARLRVKAAKDLAEVGEGLRIVAATKLRAFFLALLKPLRASMSTNMQVLQTSILLKYRPLYAFLQRRAPSVALEVQRAYISAARTYYETGFRRYLRSLGLIKARTTDKSIPIAIEGYEKPDPDRLDFGRIEGPGVALAYLAEEKSFKEPVEAVFRSMLLVLLDNATAEYSFIVAFFQHVFAKPPTSPTRSGMTSPSAMLSPTRTVFEDRRLSGGISPPEDDEDLTPRQRTASIMSAISETALRGQEMKEEKATIDAIWHQILDPALEYCQTFSKSTLEPLPPVVPLLTMIRLNEDVIAEVQKRKCGPLESFIFGLRIKMWPEFQKLMSEHVDSLKKLIDGVGSSSFFRKGPVVNDAVVTEICDRYVVMFNAFLSLTDHEEETMIFSNLLRVRQELTRLISTHTEKILQPAERATAQSTIYEVVLQGLSRGSGPTSHPKSQSEIAYWRGREEEARRRMTSATRQR